MKKVKSPSLSFLIFRAFCRVSVRLAILLIIALLIFATGAILGTITHLIY